MYGCESWNINKECRKKLEAMEMRIWRRILKIPWTQRVKNEEVLRRVQSKRELMTTIYQRQLKFMGHIERKQGLELICMTGKLEGRRMKGRPRKKYLDGVKEILGGRWTDAEIRRKMKDRREWRSMIAHVRMDTYYPYDGY